MAPGYSVELVIQIFIGKILYHEEGKSINSEVQIPAPLQSSCLVLSQQVDLLVTRFPHLWTGVNNGVHLTAFCADSMR